MNVVNLYPMIEPEKKSLTPAKDLKEVQIEPFDFHVTKLGTSPYEAEEMEFVALGGMSICSPGHPTKS